MPSYWTTRERSCQGIPLSDPARAPAIELICVGAVKTPEKLQKIAEIEEAAFTQTID